MVTDTDVGKTSKWFEAQHENDQVGDKPQQTNNKLQTLALLIMEG